MRGAIKDFIAAGTLNEHIDVHLLAPSFNSLVIQQVSANVEITGLGAGNMIILEVLNVAAVTADDFIGW